MAIKTFKIGLSNSDKATMKSEISSETISALIDEFSTSSTYAVGDYVSYNGTIYRFTADKSAGAWDSTKVETASLNDVIDDVNEAVASVADKCNPDGDYSGSGLRAASAEVADNLTPYSNESGDTQDNAFILEGTGTGNGTESVDTGSYAIIKEKQGHVLCVNQIALGTNGNGNGLTWSWSAGVLTISGLATANANIQCVPASRFVQGHQYLIKGYQGSADNISFRFSAGSYTRVLTDSVITYDGTTNAGYLGIFIPNGTDLRDTNAISLIPQVIDLTQMFNGDIPSGLTADTFFRYYQGSLAYNLGELVASNGRYLKSVGRNQWDEEWELGGYYSTGEKNNTISNGIRNKYPIRVIPSSTYYIYFGQTSLSGLYIHFYDVNMNKIGSTWNYTDKKNTTILVPNDAIYMNIYAPAYGTTYNHDITISLAYYKDQAETILEDGYDKYYAYEELENVDTGSEELNSAGDAYDVKVPNGAITRRIGSYTFTGNETWYASNKAYYTSSANINNLVKKPSDSQTANILCESLVATSAGNLYLHGDTVSGIAIQATGNIWIGAIDYANISSLTGKTIYYELATPTTEQGTPFKSNIAIDDFGSLLADNTSFNGVPMGNSIFYPVDYKAFVDSVYNRASGSAENIAISSQLLPQKSSSRLQKTLVLTGAESEDWSTSGTYTSVKRFNLAGTFYRYYDADHPRGIGEATSTGLTITWIQDSGFANITALSMCFYGGIDASVPQLILLIPNSENVTTVEELRTWLGTHNITVAYDSSKYVLEATMLGDNITYDWVAK